MHQESHCRAEPDRQRGGGMRNFALIALLFLASCGFTPLYGNMGTQNAAVREKFQQIAIASIPERNGQILRNDLVDRLYNNGIPAEPRYVLGIAPIQQHLTDLDITPESTATRAEMRLATTMTLTDKATGAALMKRELIAISSYNILGSEFST